MFVECQFGATDLAGIYRCRRCDYVLTHPSPHPASRVHRTCDRPGRIIGPGDLLAWLAHTIGISSSGDCGCARRRQRLNRWWHE